MSGCNESPTSQEESAGSPMSSGGSMTVTPTGGMAGQDRSDMGMATGGILSQGGQPVSQAGQATGGVNSGGRVSGGMPVGGTSSAGTQRWYCKRRCAQRWYSAHGRCVSRWYASRRNAHPGGLPAGGQPDTAGRPMGGVPIGGMPGPMACDPALSLMARTQRLDRTILFASPPKVVRVPIGLVLLKTTQVPC